MAPRLLTDPAALRGWVDRLASGQAAGLTDQELEALAEACLRLALHPATQAGERLRLLRQAQACDPGHPKFPYHLACAYLRHGRLDEAVEWLEQAQRMCPTSHRVWVHTSLLQRELHRRYREDERYEPAALLRRATALMAAVEQGAGRVGAELLDLHPPSVEATGADRTATPSDAAQGCRWTGVHDLIAEELLEAPASAATRDRILPHLERVASESAGRDGGLAAFAILGVAWVLGGYPVTAIRRLRARLPPDASGGSLDMLELVCELQEAEPDEVPARLAAALRQGRVPPLLAALVHHRRLLHWRRLRFPGLGAPFQAASAFLATSSTSPFGAAADPSDDRAAELADRLLGAAQALDVEPPAPIADVPPVTREERVSHAGGLIDQAEQLAGRLRTAKPELSRLAQARRERGLDAAAQAQVAWARASMEEVETLVASAMELLSAAREAGDAVTSPEALEELERLEDRGRQAKQLGPVRKALSKLGPASPAAPAPGPADTGPEAGETAPPDARSRLRSTLAEVDRRVGDLFAAAEASFDAYGDDLHRWPPLRALRALVRARRAEALYRLGQRQPARRLWCRLRREDPGRAAIARNIAVADSAGPDPAAQMAAWRVYLETLYANAILTGSLRVQATARAELHRAFAGGHAPRVLAAGPSAGQADEDDPAVAAFLASRHSVRSFVQHSLLALLAERLDLDSPTLLLGVTRTDDEDARIASRSALLGFIATACAPLPPRVRDGYLRLASNRVEAAFTASRTAEQRTLAMDPAYAEERERHLQWLESVGELKLRVGDLVRGHVPVLADLESLAFLNELVVLDQIPLTSSPALLSTARSRLRARIDGPALQDAMDRLREEVIDRFPGKARRWR